ncbi:MAG TPA: peptidylprolyl isomerase [Gemmatimonadaceae bacterium]|nr:peptidylprolyl isomerase [Gemmatimonadaceae bacterium]
MAACRPLIATAPDDLSLVRQARLLRIEDTRRDEPPFLDSLLDASDASQRAAAALAVGRIGARAHLPRLRALALDADTAVSANALFALGLLKDTASAALGSTALHAAPATAVEAAWLLGELGERGRQALTVALRDSTLSSTARGAVLLAAARQRPVPVDVVAPWVGSADSAVAWRAAYALARGRSAAGVRTLLGAADRASAVREQVARGLAKAATGDSLADTARATLRRLIADDSPRVRVNAVRALATHGRVASAPVVAALRDRDAGVRLAAAQSLDLVLDSSAVAWRDAFDSDTAFVTQRAVAAGAAKRDIVLDFVQGWSTSGDWQRRAASLELDARGAPTAAIGRLRRWHDDPDGRVRAAGVGALAALADSAEVRVTVRDELRAALRDPDVGVRTAALGALASGATHDDLSAALDAYERSSSDRDNDARLAFWALADSALARAPAGLSQSVAARLDALPRPADPLERIAAARIARFAAWRDSTSTPRPLEWYAQRVREMRATPQPIAVIETERGAIELVLFAVDAPLTVHNFLALAQRHWFDGQRVHRVVPNFVVQGGDPRGDGNGGPGYAIRDEMNRRRYLRGTVGMALSGPNTGGSQFFVTHSPQPHLDGGYTVFGQLLDGGDVLDRIVQGDRIVRVTVR